MAFLKNWDWIRTGFLLMFLFSFLNPSICQAKDRAPGKPTEAINGRLEHLRGSALGFRNLTNYIARSLLEAGGFRPRLHP